MNSPHADNEPERFAGRTCVVTGANSGIGFETARALARGGAHVVLACRSASKAEAASTRIAAEAPRAQLESVTLDLASLASIADCARMLEDRLERIDVLCHNAGVMFLPRTLTRDGFEMHIGVNHLGHFALAGQLLGLLLAAEAPRIVQVGSNAHRAGRLDLDDLQLERRYGKWRAYASSKLANMLYMNALARRLDAAAHPLLVAGAHPGYAATELLMLRDGGPMPTFRERFVGLGNRLFAQTAEEGAAPTVAAATWPGVRNGDYYGPDGWFQMRGAPALVPTSQRARDVAQAEGLWTRSVELTGVDYALLDGAGHAADAPAAARGAD